MCPLQQTSPDPHSVPDDTALPEHSVAGHKSQEPLRQRYTRCLLPGSVQRSATLQNVHVEMHYVEQIWCRIGHHISSIHCISIWKFHLTEFPLILLPFTPISLSFFFFTVFPGLIYSKLFNLIVSRNWTPVHRNGTIKIYIFKIQKDLHSCLFPASKL